MMAYNEMECLLCSKLSKRLAFDGASHRVSCKHCGEYILTFQAEHELITNQNVKKYILSSQTFENYYYKQDPLTLKVKDIENAKDIDLSEKLYKLSKFLFLETKINGLGSEINGISHLQFYCRNDKEYFQLLETLKSMNIIDFERIDSPSGALGSYNSVYTSPKLLGPAMLAFEESVKSIEDFKKVFMATKNNGNNINLNFQGDGNQLSLATNGSHITATQYNSLNIEELNTLLENVYKSLPHDMDNKIREEVKENLTVIQSEFQNQNPRKIIIKNTLAALKGIATTTGFLASLAKLYEFLQPYFA